MRSKRSCRISQSEQLSAYVDGMLDGQSLRRLSRHIEACPECQAAAAELTRMKSLLSGVRASALRPNESFWADSYRAARLADLREASPNRAPSGLFSRPSKWRLATLTAMGACAVLLSFLPSSIMRGVVSQPVEAAPILDVNTLVGSHASSTSDEPLADHPRVTMIVSDETAQQADADVADDLAGNGPVQGAPNAGPATD